MAIPETELQTWSGQGSAAGSATAYNSVKAAIDASTALASRSIEVYLQGSYRNSTNIRGDSDVDVVVQSDATFYHDLDRLAPAVKESVRASFAPATYLWDQFREDVRLALIDYYGAGAIIDKSKCITVINPGSSGINADVVPSFTHRFYLQGSSVAPYHIDDIAFKTQREGRLVVNFPKRHYERGVEKNRNTAEEFKPTVRVFKNARSYLVEHGGLGDAVAPSYFLECMLFNVGDSEFSGANWQEQFGKVFSFLDGADLTSFLCQNGMVALFGDTPEQWEESQAREFLRRVAELWNSW